jgi:membrane protein EpsK
MYEAKQRLIRNISTNILSIAVTTAIGIWMTPYLIKKLGVVVYGMIPLVISLVGYFDLIKRSISSAVGRFVAIHLGRNELEQSNMYFNTALFGLMLMSGCLIVPFMLLAVFMPHIFNVPQGYEKESILLFILLIVSSEITAITSPFQVSTFVTHRFDLENTRNILAKLAQVVIIVLCFNYLSASLKYVGVSYLLMTVLLLVFSVILTGQLTPVLRINHTAFRWSAMREMTGMGMWILLDQMGVLLYMSVSLIVINLFLGPAEVGYYGPFVQIASLFALLGVAIIGVFAPIAYQYIAKQQIELLSAKVLQAMKYVALIIALPAGLCCGLSKPFLKLWLGDSFAAFNSIMWLLVGVNIVSVIVNPMFGINRGFNRVRWPAIATLIGGGFNLVLSVILARYTPLGIYGVALAVSICLFGKNFCFTPIYTATILAKPKGFFMKPILVGIVCTGSIALSSLLIIEFVTIDSVSSLVVVGMLIAVVYLFVMYSLLLSKEDRGFIWSLVGTKFSSI